MFQREGPGPGSDQILQRLTPSSEEWSSDSPVSEVHGQGGVRGLHLGGGARAEVAFAGDFDPSLFDMVEVDLVAARNMTVRIGLRRPDRSIGSSDVHHVFEGERRVLRYDCRMLPADSGRFDELVILGNRTAAGNAQLDWTLLSVTLVSRPASAWLPVIEQPPALIALEGQARRGWGLSAGESIRTEIEVPAFHPALRLGFGPTPRGAPGGGKLHVQVNGSSSRFDLGDGWESSSIDLSAYKGEVVTIRLSAEGVETLSFEQPSVISADPESRLVLLITSDTHRGGYLGAAGSGVEVHTPNLDALAGRGVLFEDCFASSNNTLPSHVALMTGADPVTTGVTDNHTRLGDEASTLAEHYSKAGYMTAAVTSAKHMNDPWSGLGQGFDRYEWPEGELENLAPYTLGQVAGLLEDAEGAPLFLWTHLFDVHRPYTPPESEARRYYGDGDPFDRTLPEPIWPRPGALRGVRDKTWVEALYRAQVSHLDTQLDALLEHPRVRSGIVAFTADHGESLGEQGIWWDHQGVYPSVLHVPLILAWPGAPGGTRVSTPVRQFDTGRTLLSLSGLEASAFGGRDLAPSWAGGDFEGVPRMAFGSEGHAIGISQGGWHLVVNLRMPKPTIFTVDLPEEKPVELFDLRADPACENDLSGTELVRVARLGGAILRWLEAAPAGWAERGQVDEESAAVLAGLGYATPESGGSSRIDLEEVRSKLAPWLE